MYVRDRQMRLQHCNKAYVDFLQRPREQLLGSTLEELPADFEAAQPFQEIYTQTFREGEPLVQDLKLRYQGRDYYTLHWALPYRDHADNIVGIIGGWLDITERYELLTALEKRKRKRIARTNLKAVFWLIPATISARSSMRSSACWSWRYVVQRGRSARILPPPMSRPPRCKA